MISTHRRSKEELTALLRSNVVEENLYRTLLKVYGQYRFQEHTVADVTMSESQVPQVICGEIFAWPGNVLFQFDLCFLSAARVRLGC